MMESILVIVHLFLAIGLVGLILIQHGKGADMGAAFGSGASATVFGSRGASNFLSRTTGILAAVFFATSLTLAYFAMQTSEPETLMQDLPPAAVEERVAPLPPSDLPAVPEVPEQIEVLEVPVPAPDDVPQVSE
ncbi:MAG: preprotein translocase subunit SecG [Sedimenticolaceae bacterium]